ncbi:MAG: nicotinate (nicotinamide) nucleotide adenylyltransferase [Endomicrobia bacterium]|nr:nicotinate (nicotinamide) nucleotide adenylyltransferase [Endomicrobiia bacterium]
MNKIVIFGGSFDPVHKAHIDMAKETLKLQGVGKVIFVPAYIPAHKTSQFADINDRIAMLKLAVNNIEKTEISFFEAEKQDIVYSYQTLDYFKSLYPDNEILMLIGSDSLKDLPTWKNIEYLASQYKFIVAKRPGSVIEKGTKFLDRCIFPDIPAKDISSTLIRKLLKENDEQVKELLDGNVYDYIKARGLYK